VVLLILIVTGVGALCVVAWLAIGETISARQHDPKPTRTERTQPVSYQPDPEPRPPSYTPNPAYNQAPPTRGHAIASLVCGITSIIPGWFLYLSLPLAICAIVFARVDRRANGPSGMATAGLVTGLVGGIVWVLFWALVIIVAISSAS
jgi:hypothetical protein